MPGSVYILATAILWSTAGICVRLLPWSAFSIACVRGLLCGLLLFILRFFQKPFAPPRFTRHNLLAGICMFLTSTLYMLAIKMTTVANAIVLQYIAPILVLLYTMAVERRKPSFLEIMLTIVVFAGCVMTFWDELNPGSILGNIVALLSGVALAAQIIVNRHPKTAQQDGLMIGCGLSFTVFLPFLITDTHFALTPVTLGAGLFLGLVQYGFANLCFAKGIRTTDSLNASLLFTIEPILAPIWVYLFLNERPTLLAQCGSLCVILGVAAYNAYPLLHGKKSRRV